MPSKSSGRIEKARSNRKLTSTHKLHRWQSFSARVSKFHSLQPLRRVRRHDLDSEDVSTATSYFHSGLQKWGELNISKTFCSFKREVLPLSESLPQVLYFEDRIMKLLDEHIALQDGEALEPLLDMLTAFAHDLGARFEKHYARSLQLLLAIASKPQQVEVLEWTFGALAFLFKYLAKLIVPDLRPTFDLLAPLLGRCRHPQHIARFAAEAMCFLVRKAAAPSYRQTSLVPLVQHVKDDILQLSGDHQFTLYNDGLMTMFAEAIKGTDRTVHSAGSTIIAALIDAIPEDEESKTGRKIWTNLVCGILTSIIHHTDADTLNDFLEVVLDRIQAKRELIQGRTTLNQIYSPIEVLGVLAGTRKGSRIHDWGRLLRELMAMLSMGQNLLEDAQQEDGDALWNSVISNTAIIWSIAPIDALMPHISSLSRILGQGPFKRWFVPFCAYYCDLVPDRFGNILRGAFQKFISKHWSEPPNEDMLCVMLPKMIDSPAFSSLGENDRFRLPQSWQDQIVSELELPQSTSTLQRNVNGDVSETSQNGWGSKHASLLRLLEITAVTPATKARVAALLLRKLKLALAPSSPLTQEDTLFIASQGLSAYIWSTKSAGMVDDALSPLLWAAIPRFSSSPTFLQAYLSLQRSLQQDVEIPEADGTAFAVDPATISLIANLSSPSHEIRLASLELLKCLQGRRTASTCVDTMLQVEQSPLRLDLTRTMGMLLRSLGQQYASLDENSWLKSGIPRFLFGMLTVNLSPVWADAIEVMKQVVQSKSGEEAVATIALEWIAASPPEWQPSTPEGGNSHSRLHSDFECTALDSLQKQANHTHHLAVNAEEVMFREFDEKKKPADIVPATARTRALQVLNAVPSIAEKRSRQLLPYFFYWATGEDDAGITVSGGMPQDRPSSWSLADRKGMLRVISQFVNPRALYQHERVYETLLKLLENGDIDIQKLSLKGILAWKQDGVKLYQENLEYLLDDARFKNELTVFLQGEVIKHEHRPELMPVLLRLLYGRSISKKGAANGRNGPQATRLAVLRSLSVEDLGSFLDIAVGRLKGVRVAVPLSPRTALFGEAVISPRKQLGFLNMISSLISELGTGVEPYADTLLNAVLYCLIYSCRHLGSKDVEQESDLEAASERVASMSSLLKATRSMGIKCLTAIFQNAQNFPWEAYKRVILEEVVAPRLENFAVETTQGVSSMLQMFSTWSSLPHAALFLAPHEPGLPDGALPGVIACLAMEKTKADVKVFVLGILRNLAKLASAPAQESTFNELIKEELLDPNADNLLAVITNLLQEPSINNNLLEACIETILVLAPILRGLENAEALIRISRFLLEQPPRRVNPKTKGRILLIVESFISLPDAEQDEGLLFEIYQTLSSLFSYFKDRENRQSLCRIFSAIARRDEAVVDIAGLCEDLNSFKERRLDEPDYDRRLAAFNAISAEREPPWSPKQWLPLLHNLVFYLKMDEEFGVLSSNSADGVRRFIKTAANCRSKDDRALFEGYMKLTLMPSIYAGAREASETVRREYLRIMGFLLAAMPDWAPISDLKGLLTEVRQEDSSEPSFFFDILSPATARQLEALRNLEAANSADEMGSQNLAHFFIPLLEHFIYGRADGSDDHGLGAQASTTIGNLAMSLHWNHWRTTFSRYISYIGSRSEQQKQTVRLLGKFSDALVQALDSPATEAMDVDSLSSAPARASRLRLTVPKTSQVVSDVLDQFLPPLVKHLHEKDESEISYRVPVGVIIVKLLKLVPPEQGDQKLAGVLTDISHILRSKNWESREMARDTLTKISVILGPPYFGFLLKELRGALKRGYQMHVLSYTMHAILVSAVPTFQPGDLDPCLPSIVTVIMDDIFGVTGEEKDAEGYTSQMKEIKSSKSQDSMELVAKSASMNHLVELIKPIQALLLQKIDLKIVRKIDSLMGRIGAGLLQNPAAESRDALVFCFEVIQETYRSQNPETEPKMDPKIRRYLVLRGAKKSGQRSGVAKRSYKMVRFALDILRSLFKKYDHLRTPANVDGFLPILGDAIVGGEDEVKMSAFRLLAVLVKVPMTSVDGQNIYRVAVKEATKAISMSTSTTTELSQAALKMLAVVLRERRDVEVKEAAIDMLLGKLKEDFTEPLHRHVTFNFLRSVLDRQIETAAVYDTADHVGTIMINNDDKDTRDLARGAFFQFLREYPQKKARWAQQLSFIVANLKYEREGGRLSVMEMIHLLLAKSSDEFVQEVSGTCFLPLFLVLANDDSEKCRLASGALIQEIFRKSDKDQTLRFLALLRSWLEKDGKTTVLRLALQVFGYYFASSEKAEKNTADGRLVLSKCTHVLSSGQVRDADAELVETALGTIHLLTGVMPAQTLSADREAMWTSASGCLQHPEHTVKVAAVQLINAYLADFAQHRRGSSRGEPLEGSHGLRLGVDMVRSFTRRALGSLNAAEVGEDLAREIVQMLVFLGSCLPVSSPAAEDAKTEEQAEEMDEEEEEEEEEEEGHEEGSNDDEEGGGKGAGDLDHFFRRLSHILRKEVPPRAMAMNSKTAAMEVLETVYRRASASQVQSSLKTILVPLQHLTDSSIPAPFSNDDLFKVKLEGLKTRAQIVMDSLQRKFGSAEYSKTLLEIRDEVKTRRQQRTTKRKIEAIAQPEKYGRDKRKKVEKNKERRKVRSREQKSMRQAYRGW